jgi:NADPH:quinone reductase-like Zn-dependent oxidoreductase
MKGYFIMKNKTTETMKAIRIHNYGGPEVLVCEDVQIPSPNSGEVLIRIHAAGVNPHDYHVRSRFAYIPEEYRPPDLYSFPISMGWDLSGVIVEVGSGVTEFKKGDEVYGLVGFPTGAPPEAGGAYAEYTIAPVHHLAHKPKSVDHIEAAGVPLAALTAWQALFERADLQSGQSVLVNGASGGVGHFAVQFAKSKGARVIGVTSGRNAKFVQELGVDEFIDYTTTSVEKVSHKVDLVIDTVGGENGDRFLNVLKRGGTLVPIFIGQYSVDRFAAAGVAIQNMMQVHSDGSQLSEIGRLIDAGKVRIAIDVVLPLEEAYKAHELSESRRVSGKIVLKVI